MAAVAGKNPKNQIQQMVNFILQEAHEKANEIKVKTEHDFNLEKQMLVHNGKQRINQEFEQRERDREVKQRIARSTAITKARVSKMEARQELIDSLLLDCVEKLKRVPSQPSYEKTMTDLLLQGLKSLFDEDKAEVCCRSEDQSMVRKIIPQVTQAFKREMGRDIQCSLNTTIVLPSEPIRGSPSGPGLVVIAKSGGIVCDNTLSTRLYQCFEELLPQVRRGLFE